MVHALEHASKHLVPGGALVCLMPRRLKRPFIAITAPGKRQPVGALVNPASEALYSAANAAIQTVVEAGLFAPIGTSNRQFSVRLGSSAELHRYLHEGVRPPRFRPRGRQRFEALWRSRPEGARIEVTEFWTIIALQCASVLD